MVQDMDEAVVEKLHAQMRQAYEQQKAGQLEEAARSFQQAWSEIPEPKYGWDMSQITLLQFAKAFRDMQMFEQAEQWARDVFKCDPLPGDGEPVFVLGTVQFEAGAKDDAAESFKKAFELSGKRVFQDEDPRYFTFLKESDADV